MIIDSVFILIVAGLFLILAFVLNFYVGVEVLQLLREVFTQFRERNTTSTTPQTTEEEPGFADGQSITPFQDRDTVERLISHLEEE